MPFPDTGTTSLYTCVEQVAVAAGPHNVNVIVPVGLFPPASVAESLTSVTPGVPVDGVAVVEIVGDALLTLNVTDSPEPPHASLVALLFESPL